MEAALLKLTFDYLLEIAKANPDLKKTVTEVLQGTTVTGGCVAVGGLLAGPPGLVIGGLIGFLVTALTTDNFKSLPQIMQDMSREDKQKLVDTAKHILMRQTLETATKILTNASSDAAKEFVKIVFETMKNS